jgi:hypothetical protein
MKPKIINICIALSVFLLLSLVYSAGFISGKFVAEESIKSELIWYNQASLRKAIDEIKKGNLDEAEKTILRVDSELNKMKNIHNKIVSSN